jgi:lipoate-protein ligase A
VTPIVLDAPPDPERDAALGPLLLRHGLGGATDILRVYRPAPTAAFSRRDSLRPGFAAAAETVRAFGFTPLVRPQGGSLALYHAGSVVIDHVHREPGLDLGAGTLARFRHYAALHATVLRSFGADARIGPVPGEYCPGDYSINAAGTVKLAGSAQRVTRDGWLFSTVLQVTDPAPLRAALTPAYAQLDYPFDPSTVGALTDVAPAASAPEVMAALLAAYDATTAPMSVSSSEFDVS